MNRKHNRRRLLAALLAISSTTLFTTTAHAQEVKGQFTLPFAVHWGTTTLPAGDYTFGARSASTPFILTVRGNGTVAMLMAEGYQTAAGNRSSLDLTWVGDQAIVSALHLAPYGLAFSYGSRYRTLALKEASNRPPAKTGAGGAVRTAVAEIPMQVRNP